MKMIMSNSFKMWCHKKCGVIQTLTGFLRTLWTEGKFTRAVKLVIIRYVQHVIGWWAFAQEHAHGHN